jgi:hypothetical protein
MLAIFIEIIMSMFIVNFKASDHPIITVIIRGVLVALTVFLFGVYIHKRSK